MKLGRWIPLGSLILLMCAHQGEPTLILGSMLMAATAAMTGGLIMGPLTIGGLIMMMMMAANNQNAQQRQTQQTSTAGGISSTLESSQNLLNLLATLTGAASNLATSASTQQSSLINPTAPKASKRALYNPDNFADLFAESSRNEMLRRQWKALSNPTTTTTTTTTRAPEEARTITDFWNPRPTTYFSDTGFAVEPIPDDLLDIAMRLPQAKNDNMFAELFNDGTVSAGTGSDALTSTGYSGMTSPPRPISSAEQQLRWVASEPGDLFSSFPELKEEDILSLVHKRATREALNSKFRLEDIANVTYANEKDPVIKDELVSREKQEELNTRIFRQLSALDPFRCLPQLACNMQAAAPTKQTGILNDYAYLLKTVFERDDEEDDENEEKKPGSTSVKKQASSSNGGSVTSGSSTVNVASEIMAALTSQGKRKKKLDYKSPSKSSDIQAPTRKGNSSSKKKKSDDGKQDDREEEEEEDDDDDDDGFSSEEVPMDEDELDRLLMKEKYEMEQAANEELLTDDPDMLPYILKSASKGPPYLGPDKRPSGMNIQQAAAAAGVSADSDLGMSPMLAGGSSPQARPNPGMMGGRGPGMYAQPSPLFSASKLTRYRTEDLEGMSSGELSNLLRQVSDPGEVVHIEDGAFDDPTGRFKDILASFVPSLPKVAVGFTRRRTHTGKPAFDDDPFFDDFDFRRRSMNFQTGPMPAVSPAQPQKQAEVQGQPKLRKVRRVVRRVKREGTAARAEYLRSMKRILDAEMDPAEVFRVAKEVGAKVKSPRQCRFLFSRCPLNSSQLLGMIGNIRKAVMGLSNAQTLMSGNLNLAALAQQQQQQKDFEGNSATIGPNVVTTAVTTAPPTTTTPVPPLPVIHQLSPMAPMQLVQPIYGMPQSAPPPPPPPTQPPAPPPAAPTVLPHASSSQNTIVVPQIVQVPMPIQAPAPQPAAQQPIFIQQPAPQMIFQPQQMQNPSSAQSHPVFNIITDSAASQNNGQTSISHEYPTGDQLEISMLVNGQQAQASQTQPGVMVIPMTGTKTRKKVTIPASAVRPVNQVPIRVALRPAAMQTQSVTMAKNPAADLIDLFDDDNSDNYLLPQKTLIDTEIKAPSTSIDSLQAAILAIEKINQAATDKSATKLSYLEDDETDDYKGNSKLTGLVKKPVEMVPAPPKVVPAGMRLPNRKKDEVDDDDETSEEEDDDEDDEGEEYRYRTRLPDPLDPKRRNFIPVPTKNTQFQDASELTVPATQTFVKKHLQVQDSGGTSSSEEDEQQQASQRRMMAVTRRRVRRPKILYPQEEVEKPVFIPL